MTNFEISSRYFILNTNYAVACGVVSVEASTGSATLIFLIVRRHFVHNLRRTKPVVVWIRALCKFGLNVRGVRRLE